MNSSPLFPVRHEPLYGPEKRFTGTHRHYCYDSISLTPPTPGQPLIRRCPKDGNLFRWEGAHWKYMGGVSRWRNRRRISLDMDWLAGDGAHDWKRPTHWLRRLLLRLRGWDA